MDPLLAIFFAFLFSALTVVGVVGNLTVIVAIAGDRKMRRSVMNILLLNLAVADLSNVVLAMSDWVPPVLLTTHSWFLPSILCPICRYLECMFLYTSISTQLIVCIERYIATVLPMRARQLCSRRNAFFAVCVAWIFCGTLAIPYLMGNQIKENRQGELICSNTWVRSAYWTEFKWAEFVLFYLFPCVAIIAVYTKVATVLWARNPQLHGAPCLSAALTVQTEHLRRRRSVVNMLIACTVVYFLCYSPIQAIFISRSVLNIAIQPPYSAVLLMNALAITCSASNPLLYTLFSERFRNRLKRVLSSFCNILPYRKEPEKQNESRTENQTLYAELASRELSSDRAWTDKWTRKSKI